MKGRKGEGGREKGDSTFCYLRRVICGRVIRDHVKAEICEKDGEDREASSRRICWKLEREAFVQSGRRGRRQVYCNMAPDDTTARYPSSPSSTPSPSSAMSSGVLVQPEDGSSAVSGSSTENVAFASDTTLQNGNDMDTSESTSISRSASEHSSRTDAASSTQDRHRLKQRTRGKSNSLGEDPRGDTGAAALATLQSVPFVSYSSSSSSGLVSNQDPSKPGFGGSGGNAEEKNQQRQQQQLKQLPRTSKRRKARTLFRRWRSVSQRHTWLTPLIICLAVVSAYLVNPRPSNPLHKALFLSYPIETDLSETDGGNVIADPGYDTNDTTSYSEQSATVIPSLKRTMYGKGPADFAFVAFYTIFLSFTREFIMQRILRPIATSAALRPHLRSRAKQARFMEQAYTAIYFAVLGPFGLYVMRYQSPLWYFNTRAMYEGFPHRLHQAAFKAYYLIEASYWLQQMGVLLLMLEKPRKDFKELVAHHIITLALIGLSYRFHFTYMGLAVYITHDVSDFFLAVSSSPMHRRFLGATTFAITLLTNLAPTDQQDPKLHLLLAPCPVLCQLHRHLDIPTALHKSPHPRLRSH